jgi:uncharacterized protein YsxB (DUF464 family)
MTVEGHSGHGKKGSDIVCSACSILAYTLAGIVESEKENDSFMKEPTIEMKDGKITIECEPKPAHYNEILHAFYVVETGYNLLKHNYPDNVELLSFGKA